jgi:histidine--tRNA ligase
MAFVKKSMTGMKDILPKEMELREYLLGIIQSSYKSYGFNRIETPALEDISNLTGGQGGDNEKLIFKILKRGEKLNLETAKKENDLVDAGLRYDLTVPLARYYANNSDKLISPFKSLQIGSVWRAERPQKGRFRQFTQCDIDILGDATNAAEIELILATTGVLSKLCPKNKFTLRINDRNILSALVKASGIEEKDMSAVFIILDKLDKIGIEGVKKELTQLGIDKEKVENYIAIINKLESSTDNKFKLEFIRENTKEFLPDDCIDGLLTIINVVEECKTADFNIIFDASLVRGMGYYTGTIFEVSMEGFSGSVAGGGRYDKVIGKFSSKEVPACGFSIGFERIVTILTEENFEPEKEPVKKAYLYEKGLNDSAFIDILHKAKEDRKKGLTVLVTAMNKNKKFQKEQLSLQGYTEFMEVYKEELKK